MEVNIQPPDSSWGALAILAGSIITALIGQIGLNFRTKQRTEKDDAWNEAQAVIEQKKDTQDGVERAYAWALKAMTEQIEDLKERLDKTEARLGATQKLLDVRTKEWMQVNAAHTECERRLGVLESTVRELQDRSGK